MAADRKSYETLLLDEEANVLVITINRPEVANALNTQMGRELYELFEQLALETLRYRCIIITGASEKAFCAGGDLLERNRMSDEGWKAQHLIFERMVRALLACP